MAFEKYNKKIHKCRGNPEPRLSILKNSIINFNNSAVKNFSLGNHERLEFYFDKQNKQIGIKPLPDGTYSPNKLTHRKDYIGRSYTTAYAFLNYHGIVRPQRHLKLTRLGDMLVVNVETE